jgi:hypothetical protein
MKRAVIAACASALACAAVPSLAAQGGTHVGGRSEVFAGGELEGYLRSLQTLGQAGSYPWALRGFSPQELDRILPRGSAHPWAARYDLRPDTVRALHLDLVRPVVALRFNSTFPYGGNDGAVWAGRGLTTSLQGGVAIRWGPLSATLAPVLFRAENVSLPLLDGGAQGDLRYNNGQFPAIVDQPQRFGPDAYARLDPGQSTVRLDAFGTAIGISTANQVWGPADRFPMVLGTNAPGIPHLFLGTAAPLNAWIARVHARVIWGVLDQSPYSPVSGSRYFRSLDQPGTRRFATGIIAVVQPRGMPGLELGGSRFFHSPWREGGPTAEDLKKPFESIFKRDVQGDAGVTGDPFQDFDNQVGSLFARAHFPGSGFELYGEFYREDHSWDLRDFLNEPDHAAGYVVGARKAFRRGQSLVSLRGEVSNLEAQPVGLWRVEGVAYTHAYLRQGHTNRGQLLGADLGVGSSGASSFGVDWYSPRGRRSLTWTRTLRQTNHLRDPQGLLVRWSGGNPRAFDVMHALSAETLLFRGALDLVAGGGIVHNFNRNFQNDATNLTASLSVRRDF